MSYLIALEDVTRKDLSLVGGKNAFLGDMIQHLGKKKILIPPGFAITTNTYRLFLKENHLQEKIDLILKSLDHNDPNQLTQASNEIQYEISLGKFQKEIEEKIISNFYKLVNDQHSVAIRSSATAEDLPEASFAGQQETFLNIDQPEKLIESIKKVYASLFSERAISYRYHHHIPHKDVAISVGIQRMVRSDLAASGVTFTLDTETGFQEVIYITATYGLGEAIVQGKINPDEFYVHKPNLNKKGKPIIKRSLGSKKLKMIYGEENTIKSVEVDPQSQNQFCITDQDILLLAKQARIIERYYGMPMDIEWAKDGIDGKIYTVQARPETVKSREDKNTIEQFQLLEKGKIIISGQSVGQRIAQGHAKIILNPKDKHLIQQGDILVTESTDPDWEPIMKKAAGIITNQGGRTCHAAIVARELGIPAIIGTQHATTLIQANQALTLSCAQGEVGYVLEGLIPFKIKKIKINKLPRIPINIAMNVANPATAFALQFIPNKGVGLARMEFIINSMIGIHPNAILQFSTLIPELKKEIQERTQAYSSPKEFYIEKLSEGISTIAAAFYPHPVVVRFSDFKTNEYANLLGGQAYEPTEENPMLGYRGAYRYITPQFKSCFSLECEAIKRAREIKHLKNIYIMVPFVRTVNEAKSVLAILKKEGLVRNQKGLKIYMMCEVPSNILLAEQFLKLFDGYSIGSNDLTQLILGVDRDSELVASVFDERNEAVKKVLHSVIRLCKKKKKYIGICGQAPSDHLDFARWLIKEGIGTISLNPDVVLKTWIKLHA